MNVTTMAAVASVQMVFMDTAVTSLVLGAVIHVIARVGVASV